MLAIPSCSGLPIHGKMDRDPVVLERGVKSFVKGRKGDLLHARRDTQKENIALRLHCGQERGLFLLS
jgi:hypothetical protein